MEFLGIGPGELILILLIALLVLGPERLPEVADQLGRGLGWLRRASDEVARSLTEELAVPRRKTWKPQTGPGPAAEPQARSGSESREIESEPPEGEEAGEADSGSG